MIRSRSVVAATVLTTAAALAVPTAGSAAPAPSDPVSDPIVSGLAGPLQLDVGSHGQIYVGQSFAGILTKVWPDGTTEELLTEKGEVAGVASDGYSVAYTFLGGDEEEPVALIKRRFDDGRVRTVANLGRYEAKHNPDGRQVYGFLDLKPWCAAQVPPEVGGEPYTGIVESHPYAIGNGPHGSWYVADAAANAIFQVWPGNKIKVVAVLPPQKTRVTQEAADSLGLPACVVGKTYAFEAVPTDVEVTRSGHLVVSLLPGGPEDASLGARGAVVLVGEHGRVYKLGDGFLGAANVAVAPHGKIYVSELFGNKVSLLRHGRVTTVAEVPSPAGLEYAHGRLYASVDVLANGSIVTIRP